MPLPGHQIHDSLSKKKKTKKIGQKEKKKKTAEIQQNPTEYEPQTGSASNRIAGPSTI